MITCRDLLEHLCDFVAGECAPDVRQHIVAHLDGCPPCEALAHTYQLTIRLARKLACHCPSPAHLEERFCHRARAELQRPADQQPPASA